MPSAPPGEGTPSAFRASATRRSVSPSALKAAGDRRQPVHGLGLGPLRNHIPLVLRDGVENVQGEAGRMGLSTAMKSTLASISSEMNATFRASRSSLAMISVALCLRGEGEGGLQLGTAVQGVRAISLHGGAHTGRPSAFAITTT